MTDENLQDFVKNFNLPINKKQLEDLEYLSFDKDSEEYKYLISHRKELGGFLPKRSPSIQKLEFDNFDHFNEYGSSSKREMSTTMVFVRIITSILRDKSIGNRIVPIVPDEARTFGMDGLFRQFGIYSREGQKYEPEDSDKSNVRI